MDFRLKTDVFSLLSSPEIPIIKALIEKALIMYLKVLKPQLNVMYLKVLKPQLNVMGTTLFAFHFTVLL